MIWIVFTNRFESYDFRKIWAFLGFFVAIVGWKFVIFPPKN